MKTKTAILLVACLTIVSWQSRAWCAEPSIEDLIRQLADPERTWDAEAALAAKGAQSIPALVAALDSDNGNLGSRAADVLGMIGDPGAIAPLSKLAARNKVPGAARALQAIGRIGGPEAATVLIQALPAWRDNLRAEWDIAEALGAIGDNRAVEPLIRHVEGVSKAGRLAAVKALGCFRDPRSRAALKKTIASDPDWVVYRAARKALHHLDSGEDMKDMRFLMALAIDSQPEPKEGAEKYVENWWKHPEDTAVIGPNVMDFATAKEIARAKTHLAEYARNQEGRYDVEEDLMEYFRQRKIPTDKVMRAQEVLVLIGPKAIPPLENGVRRGSGRFKEKCQECLEAINKAKPAAQPGAGHP